jgi:hypothetical protein
MGNAMSAARPRWRSAPFTRHVTSSAPKSKIPGSIE